LNGFSWNLMSEEFTGRFEAISILVKKSNTTNTLHEGLYACLHSSCHAKTVCYWVQAGLKSGLF
jgi:hypothetical protein